MPTALFIRHGESESNAGLATSYPAEIALTTKGIEQAKHIALSLILQPSLIVTSSYIRSKQTAQPTMLRFPTAPREEWPVHEFTYLSPLNCQQTNIIDRRPMVYAYWQRCDPFYIDGEGAESFVDFLRRVQYILERLKQLEGDFIAIFSHELFIRAVIWFLLVAPFEISSKSMRQFRSFLTSLPFPNGSIVKVQCQFGEEVWLSKIMVSHLPSHLLPGSVDI